MLKNLLFFLLLFSQVSYGQVSDTSSGDSKKSSDATIYSEVDAIASFPGGRPAWIKFIEKNLNPGVGVENGAKKGTYNVVIRFTVTREGELKDFEPVTKYRHGFEDEVIRVLKLSPNWVPAIKNGEFVNSKYEQLQVFKITIGR